METLAEGGLNNQNKKRLKHRKKEKEVFECLFLPHNKNGAHTEIPSTQEVTPGSMCYMTMLLPCTHPATKARTASTGPTACDSFHRHLSKYTSVFFDHFEMIHVRLQKTFDKTHRPVPENSTAQCYKYLTSASWIPTLPLCHMFQSPDQKWVGQRRAHAVARWCTLVLCRL